MALRDHYKTLEIATTATLSEVKKAYRSLAHRFHPDKNQDNPYAEARFREIQEAYSVLSDERRRKLYDEERYFAGLSSVKEPAKVTSRWILAQAKKLSHHMKQVDSHRMNHQALHDYVLLLLSDAHLAILHEEHDGVIQEQIVEEVLTAVRNIHYRWFPPLAGRLSLLAGARELLQQQIHKAELLRRRKAREERFLPLVVLVIALLLCFIMVLYSRP